jgi:glycosyltransferase involved in cell wall biosynthesis
MTAVSYVRFLQPFRGLAVDGYELRTLGESLRLTRHGDEYRVDPSLLDGIDLVIFPQNVSTPALADGGRVRLVESMLEEAAGRDIPVVYSVDDYLPEIEPANPQYDRIAASRDNIAAILDSCSAIVVTTPALARSMSRLGKPIFEIPNAVDPERLRQRPRNSARTGRPTVGWSGSSSHLDDLLMIVPALAELQARSDFEFVLYGLLDRPFGKQLAEIRRNRRRFTAAQRATAERFETLAMALRQVQYRHVPFEPLERFFDRLPALDLDIGLCPLLDTPFNRHKSALKAYEYAAVGSLCVASDVEPYRGEVSLTVPNDTVAWVDTLAPLLADHRAREAEAARQREFVLRHRSSGSVLEHWRNALETILRGNAS